MKKILFVLLLTVTVNVAALAQSQIPKIMTFQGFVTKDSMPFTGVLPASFTLYDAPSGGNQVWNQQSQNVTVQDGYYGTVLDFSVNWQNGSNVNRFTKQYYLEVLINSNVQTPRIQLSASPYAMNALRADTADVALRLVQDAPIGTIVAFGGSPLSLSTQKKSGWFLCNGQRLHKDEFPLYAQQVGTIYGGDGGDSVNIPDLRGLFLRGVNAGRTDSLKDSDFNSRVGGENSTKVGSTQMDAFQGHWHAHNMSAYQGGQAGSTLYNSLHEYSASFGVTPNTTIIRSPINDNVHGDPRTSAETRPKNAAVYWLIKVK